MSDANSAADVLAQDVRRFGAELYATLLELRSIVSSLPDEMPLGEDDDDTQPMTTTEPGGAHDGH